MVDNRRHSSATPPQASSRIKTTRAKTCTDKNWAAHGGGPTEVHTNVKAAYLSAQDGPMNTKLSTSPFAPRAHLFRLRSPLSSPSSPSVRAMDPVAPRRGRLPIHLLVVLLTVLVALTVRSRAEVITLTEETFSDKVPPALLGLFSPPYLPVESRIALKTCHPCAALRAALIKPRIC